MNTALSIIALVLGIANILLWWHCNRKPAPRTLFVNGEWRIISQLNRLTGKITYSLHKGSKKLLSSFSKYEVFSKLRELSNDNDRRN